MNLDSNFCFDRYSLYGPYGYGEDEEWTIEGWKKPSRVSWENVRWGQLQQECLARNKNRYDPSRQGHDLNIWRSNGKTSDDGQEHGNSLIFESRTAVIIRAWDSYNYMPNDLYNIRSMIVELSLRSGGKYEVFLLVHVKDADIPIFSDRATYDEVKKQHVPLELQDIAELFNLNLLKLWYPKVGEYR